jgi:hypothetical protein
VAMWITVYWDVIPTFQEILLPPSSCHVVFPKLFKFMQFVLCESVITSLEGLTGDGDC